MTINQAYQQLIHPLYVIYDQREAKNIAQLVLEKITGYSRLDRLIHRDESLTESQLILYNQMATDLLHHKPAQYVLGEAWFYGMRLIVNETVLIPRPETEELVELILQKAKLNNDETLSIVDIGTGSGCIALAIKNKIPSANVYATDISDTALQTAQKNAEENKLAVSFMLHNILEKATLLGFPFDIIVSNPPYITYTEKKDMMPHVVNYEPHTALFVDDADPLLFYRSILDFSIQNLKKGGAIFFEINENFGKEMIRLVEQYNFVSNKLIKDLSGKDRFMEIQK